MKACFKLGKRFGRKLPLIVSSLILAMPFVSRAQQATFISPAIVNAAINVNATNFINAGVWNINVTPQPYKTFSTYNYTNTGTMNSSIGWQFDHGPYPSGNRDWSANFLNDNTGIISALDGNFIAVLSIYPASQLLISATNIVNKGMLSAGSFGEIVLQGSGVNLTRSGLEITPIQGGGSFNDLILNEFSPDTAIYDQYWSGGTNTHFFSGPQVWNGTTVGGAEFNVGAPCNGSGVVQIGPLNPQVSSYLTNNYGAFILFTTNMDLTTVVTNFLYSNVVHQAIFVSVADPNIDAAVAFGLPLSPTNIFRSMVAQLSTTSTNQVTKASQTSYVYVVDDLAANGTNGALLQNLFLNPSALCTDPTYRPSSVVVSRAVFDNFTAGSGDVVPPTFFYDPLTYSNSFSIGRADAYSALVDNLAAEPLSGFNLSNAPGKIIINAGDLNLSKVRMSAGAEILIQASNLISSAGAVMDCQNLSYDFGATNGLLNITNLSGQSVQRFKGTVNEWSGIWTNYIISVYTNYVADTNTPPQPVLALVTNVSEVDMAITVVDGSGLASTLPVIVQNLVLHSTNIVVSDAMNVVNSLLFDGQSLTIGGSISLSGQLDAWNLGIAPNLLFFTNNGTLQIPNDAHFGDQGSTNYAVFVNNGILTAGNEVINSSLFLSGGSQTAQQGFLVTTLNGKIENGSITSVQDAQFVAGTLKLNGASITADGQLYFNVTGSLFDAGGASGNVLICGNGFNLPIKPATGDLLGTELETITPEFAAVDHYWSALDLGNSPAGYTNNEAVGKLALQEGAGSEFVFHATGVQNAIYVDLLDLSQCPDFLDPDVFTIDSNFVIYYAAVKLPSSFVVPPNTNGIPQEPEEYLNGKLGGHLVWVSGFAGPNSSVDVLVHGQTVQVNKALRYSKIIDSNGNGIANFYDTNPFDPTIVLSGAVAQGNPPAANKFAISWTAAPHSIYQVQYSTSMVPPSWSLLQNYTNNASASVMVTVWDTNAPATQRYYRVSHQ